tara:strand:- start:5931 stop:6107 length:177 start_codon:yes stop_codon:yes gene_type:complete
MIKEIPIKLPSPVIDMNMSGHNFVLRKYSGGIVINGDEYLKQQEIIKNREKVIDELLK